MDGRSSGFGVGVFVGVVAAIWILTLFAVPRVKQRAYARGLCHGHRGIQVEIADTLACIKPPTAVRFEP